jgi:hypothetical protein
MRNTQPEQMSPVFFKLGHRATRSALRICADIVAKVFLGWRTKILRAADASYARRREGPYRFIQNRPRVSAESLTSDAAAEKSRDRLSRDFLGCSIFDFCNNICQQQNCPASLVIDTDPNLDEIRTAPAHTPKWIRRSARHDLLFPVALMTLRGAW